MNVRKCPASLFVVLSLSSFLCTGCERKEWIGSLEIGRVFEDSSVRKLARAGAHGDIGEVERLIREGVNVNATGENGITPLCWAVSSGSFAGVEALVKHGANPNVTPKDSPSPMEAATEHPEILRLLIRNGGNVNLKSATVFGHAPLHGANLGGHAESTRILVDAGAELEIQDAFGLTPLFHACQIFKYENALLLVEAGADWRVTVQTHDGRLSVLEALRRAGTARRKGTPTDAQRLRLISVLEERAALERESVRRDSVSMP
jgi:ankyrin repeat protein